MNDMSDRQDRLKALKDRITKKVKTKQAISKAKTTTLGRIYDLYKKSITAHDLKVPRMSNKNKAIYCRTIKKQFEGDLSKIKIYFDYCMDSWEELTDTKFTKLNESVPPLAFIATISVIATIESHRTDDRPKRVKNSDRGNYDNREGEWVETPKELRIFNEAKEQGINLTSRKEYEDYINQ